ncbi:hypothetical protein [Bradyrhizobium liaoningense]
MVFIDETWIKTNMAPLRGWGPCGQRLQASAPFGHWKTMTFIAALRHDRISGKRVFYRTGYARGWPRRRVTPGPSSVIGTAWLT